MVLARYRNAGQNHNIKTDNIKWSRYRPGVAQGVGRGIALLFHDLGTRRGEWSAARPGRTSPPGKTRYPLYRRLGGPQGRSGLAVNLVPTGIRSRTVQPDSSVAIPTELSGPHLNRNKIHKSISHLTTNTSPLHYKEHAVDADSKMGVYIVYIILRIIWNKYTVCVKRSLLMLKHSGT